MSRDFTYSERQKLFVAARETARARGCTCGDNAGIELLRDGVGHRRLTAVAIEHLKGCPLWTDAEITADTEPDATVMVDLNR